MVKASRAAANQLIANPKNITDRIESTTPSEAASSPLTLPAGTGRPRVRRICWSMSASYHMFSAPEAPAPIAMHSTAIAPSTGWIGARAASRPVRPVNTTSDMTRGFISWK